MEKQITAHELKAQLAQFTGTENYYRHGIGKTQLLITDGIKYLAETAACYWLLDIILSHQVSTEVNKEKFQVWKLLKQSNGTWLIRCTDGNHRLITAQRIPYSDFPLENIDIWFTNNVAMLPSEY